MTHAVNPRTTHAPVQPVASLTPIVGRTFGRLYVIGYTGVRDPTGQKRAVTCRCSCGLYIDTMKSRLLSGNTTSCGCAQSELTAQRNAANAKHGAARGTRKEGTTLDPLYRAWQAIKSRCFSQTHTAYEGYGGRGITMHMPWATSFVQFRDDIKREIGLRPSRAYSLDRIDNDGNYEPGNLKWSTSDEQNRNQRTTRRYELIGESRTLGEWADLAGVTRELVASRVLRYGWPLDEALGTPPGAGRCPLKDRRKWTDSKVT